MFLKSLDLYGFKSFADKTHIDFADGITSLLGPNGCGKSNIVDAIKWVLGEQSMKTIRAGKKEDVIFNGTDTRKPMNFAEVTLVIDNSGHVLPTDLEEVEIKRRVFRSGESEYYLNKQRCLLRNIAELFYDTGVGKTAYSILEQGKIDQILSTKPEDRRYIFEEAAGISRYKQQCNEAQNKLLRTEENIRDIEAQASSAKRICDRTRNQAEKAINAKALEKECFDLDIQFHLGQLRTYTLMKDNKEQLLVEAEKNISDLKTRIDTFTDDINSEQDAVRVRNEELHAIQLSITSIDGKISSVDQLVSVLDENLREFAASERENSIKADEVKNQIAGAKAEIESFQDKVQDDFERLAEEEKQLNALVAMKEESSRKIAELEAEISGKEKENDSFDDQLQTLSQELKDVIEELISEVDENTGSEFSQERRSSCEKALADKAEELKKAALDRLEYLKSLKESVPVSKEMLAKDFSRLAEGFDRIIELFADYRSSIPPVVDMLLSPEGLMGKKRDIEKREALIRKSFSENRIAISDGRERLQILRADMNSLSSAIDAANLHYAELKASVDSSRLILQNMMKSISDKEETLEDIAAEVERARRRMSEISENLRSKDAEKKSLVQERADKEKLYASRAAELGDMNSILMSKRREKESLVSQLTSAQTSLGELKVWIENSGSLTSTVMTNFFTKYGRNLGEFMEEYKDKDIPSETDILKILSEKQRELQSYGSINYMAEQEYEEALEQYKFYAKHLEDLEKAKRDLQQVLDEITAKSVELFTKTYKEISNNFQAMFKRLFGGGRAEITLEDPENVLTSGIDILAQPPGKKPQYLNLLSGGERSMTAVALLFATYEVKPSPFCILDELDAALDDRNIGFFLSVLTEFARTSQFIIITHNKHTVTGSEQLLGVTQMEAGVSTTVSYRLGSIAGEPTILNENNEVVEIRD